VGLADMEDLRAMLLRQHPSAARMDEQRRLPGPEQARWRRRVRVDAGPKPAR
jgi:hypothetical protein